MTEPKPNIPQSGKSSQLPDALPPSRRANIGAGRPTLLTEDMIRGVCQSLEGGAFIGTAAAKQGINDGTLRTWLRRGARDLRAGIEDSLHARLVTAVKEADAWAEDRLTMHASKAAEKYWMAALSILERRWPGRWKRPTDDREAKRAILEAVLKAVVDTIRLVREAQPGLSDDELVAYVFEHIELPFEDAPEPTSPRDASATAPMLVQIPSSSQPPAKGPVIDAETEDAPALEAQRAAGAEEVLKGDGKP